MWIKTVKFKRKELDNNAWSGKMNLYTPIQGNYDLGMYKNEFNRVFFVYEILDIESCKVYRYSPSYEDLIPEWGVAKKFYTKLEKI